MEAAGADNSKRDRCTVHVHVIDVNDNAPVFEKRCDIQLMYLQGVLSWVGILGELFIEPKTHVHYQASFIYSLVL